MEGSLVELTLASIVVAADAKASVRAAGRVAGSGGTLPSGEYLQFAGGGARTSKRGARGDTRGSALLRADMMMEIRCVNDIARFFVSNN
jgi:hypothetical protein